MRFIGNTLSFVMGVLFTSLLHFALLRSREDIIIPIVALTLVGVLHFWSVTKTQEQKEKTNGTSE